MQAISAASDWVLRRLFKDVIKRHFAQIFSTEIDPQQLDVQLTKGALELRECLLDAAYLNLQLADSAFEIEAVLLGKISVSLFPPGIVVEDAVVTVRQKPGWTAPPPPPAREQQQVYKYPSTVRQQQETQDGTIDQTAIGEGVRLIASTVRSLLQGVKAEGRGLVFRIRLATGSILTLNLDRILLEDGMASGSEDVFEGKKCSFSGLAVQLDGATEGEVLGSVSWQDCECNGTILVTWPNPEGEDEEGSYGVNVSLTEGATIVFSPHAIPELLAAIEHSHPTVSEQHQSSRAQAPSAHTSHPLTRSMLVAEAVSSSQIVKALMLPEGEQFLEEELSNLPGAKKSGEEVDEFFDAVADLMSQSFFSTASSIFFDNSEAVEDHQVAEEEEHDPLIASQLQTSPKFAVHVDFCIPVVDVWVVCASEVATDPWYLRLHLLAIEGQQSTHSTTKLSIRAIELSEYTVPSEGELRERGRCRALAQEILSQQTALSTSLDWFIEKPPFADTIHRLHQLKRIDASPLSLPANYEMRPIMAVTASGNRPAIGLQVFRDEMKDPSSMRVTLLVQEMHVWVDIPLLRRIDALASCLSPISDRSNPDPTRPAANATIDVFASSASVACFLSGTAAIVLQIGSDSKMDRNFSDFVNGLPLSRDHPPFLLYEKQADHFLHLKPRVMQLYHAVMDEARERFEILAGGSINDMSVLVRFDVDISRDAISLPSAIGDNFFPASNIGGVLNGFDVEIAGDVCISVSPAIVANCVGFSESLSEYRKADISSGAVRVHVAKLDIEIDVSGEAQSPYLFQIGDFAMLTLGDSSTAAVVRSLRLKKPDSKVFLDTMSSEGAALSVGFIGKRNEVIVHSEGLILEDSFINSNKSVLSDLKALAPSSKTGNSKDGVAISFIGNHLVVVHSPSPDSELAQVSVALHLESLNFALPSMTERAFKVDHAALYLREGQLAKNRELPGAGHAPEWLQGLGFHMIAREDGLLIKQQEGETEEVSLISEAFRASITKDSAVLLRTLLGSLPGEPQHQPTPTAASRTVTRQPAAEFMEEALLLDIRSLEDDRAASPIARSDNIGDWFDTVTSDENMTDSSYSDQPQGAQMGGNGVWFSENTSFSQVFKENYVPNTDEFREYGTGVAIPRRCFKIKASTINVTLIDTLAPPGMDVLEGSLAMHLEDGELCFNHFSTDSGAMEDRKLIGHYSCSLRRINIRHDIHPPQAVSSSWHDVFISPHLRREAFAVKCMAQRFVYEDDVGPNESSHWRIRTTCSPIYMGVDQQVLAFLREFFSFVNLDAWQFVEDDEEDFASADPALFASIDSHIDGFGVSMRYTPCRFDAKALRKGSLIEILNILPRLKANLWLRELKLNTAESWSILATIAATRWLEDVLSTQMSNFLVSLPGIKSFYRVGSVAREFAVLPSSATAKDFRKQLRRALVRLCSAVANDCRDMAGALKKK